MVIWMSSRSRLGFKLVVHGKYRRDIMKIISALRWTPAPVALATVLLLAVCAHAIDLSNGLMLAVPAPKGPPPLDGSDTGWDLSGAEPVWMSTQLAKQLHASLALNYDADALYVYARVSLPGRKVVNPNGPLDQFWYSDCVELRLCSDAARTTPLNMQNPADRTDRVCHVTFWKDSRSGTGHMNILYGGLHGGEKGKAADPAGSTTVVTESENQYLMQARLPWSALNVPGGKNPFVPGSRMIGVWAIHWVTPTWFYSVNAVYSSDPGDFAFLNWGTWGRIEFSPAGNLKPRHATMDEALAAAIKKPLGVPITIEVPAAGKISVNIISEHGEVIRELTGGQPVPQGKFTVYWDGRDQWGFDQPAEKYRWGAYLSHGLKARYVGFVGSSGNPPYPTADGKGGWGGDHGVPTAVAADQSGIYLGWLGCEAQRQIVKLDYDGNVQWRAAPYLPGGAGDLRALAANGKYLFAAYDGLHPRLARLDRATGTTVWYAGENGKNATLPIAAGAAILPPPNSLPAEGGTNGMGRVPQPWDGTQPECIGLAATAKEVFAAVYSQNIIQVLDVATGEPTRSLACYRPRGLALDAHGNLYAVCCGTEQSPKIVRFHGVQGEARPIVASELVAPVGVAVDAAGQIHVTDEGTSQQIKTFDAGGKLLRTLGKPGGRPWAGTYDPTSYRDPSQIVADQRGAVVVAESSVPKIFDRIDAASGKTLSRWFGWPGYGMPNVPDAEDPLTCYFPFEPEGFARATVSGEGQTGLPDAYWVPPKAGMQEVGVMFDGAYWGAFPDIAVLDNGRKYFIEDANPHAVCLIRGDQFLPVGSLEVDDPAALHKPHPERLPITISIWIDRNGDHQRQPGEVVTISSLEGKPLPHLGTCSTSMRMDSHGNAYILGMNCVLKIPADGFAENGAILWNPAKVSYAVPVVLPSLVNRNIGGRQGMPGVRIDGQGNVYTCLSAVIPGLTPALAERIRTAYPDIPQSKWCAYATDALAKQMSDGLGHTANSNMAKFAKYGPDGRLLWMAGRKATAAAGHGEMYHFWDIGGMVGDNYVAGCSEWGTMYFYTSDGFYVDMLMNDPALLPPAGPYTFGSETFSGYVRAFDRLKKVYAYTSGEIYAVDGFDEHLRVAGERRLYGSVALDKVYGNLTEPPPPAPSLQMVPLSGDDASRESAWKAVPTTTMTRSGATLATVQLSYDETNLYARIHVVDDTPLVNGGDDPNVVFKSGDVVGLDLGPAGDRDQPGSGDLRILAAKLQGVCRLIAMKPVSRQAKRPQKYFTPASGTKAFDFVGDIPNGKAVLTADADGKGYTAWLTVPRIFLEFPLTPGASIKGDVEVLLSGMKTQGLQAVSRNWLYSGGHSQTTMTDDIPTEAWLYPQFWGTVSIK